MKCILVILSDERMGGPTRQIIDVCRNVDKLDANIIVILPHGDKYVANELRATTAQTWVYQPPCFRRTPRLFGISFIMWLLCAIPFLVWLTIIILKFRPHKIWIHGLLNVLGLVGSLITRTRIIWHVHNLPVNNISKSVARILSYLVKMNPGSTILVSSELTGQHYNFAIPYTVLNPGIDIKHYCFVPHEDRVATIITVGNINTIKDHQRFINVVNKVQVLTSYKYHGVIIGDKLATQKAHYEYITWLVNNAKCSIKLITNQHDPAMYLKQSTVFLLTSKTESFCIAAIEAMACGLPVISTYCGGPESYVIPGLTGVLCHTDEELATACASLLNDRETWQKLSVNSYKYAQKYYSLDRFLIGLRGIL